MNEIEDFDFGFTSIDDIEKTPDSDQRLQLMYDTIIPLLDNLCHNPDKPTIHWPNRVEKITEFKEKLKNILEGK
jgi:hypothetical protein